MSRKTKREIKNDTKAMEAIREEVAARSEEAHSPEENIRQVHDMMMGKPCDGDAAAAITLLENKRAEWSAYLTETFGKEQAITIDEMLLGVYNLLVKSALKDSAEVQENVRKEFASEFLSLYAVCEMFGRDSRTSECYGDISRVLAAESYRLTAKARVSSDA